MNPFSNILRRNREINRNKETNKVDILDNDFEKLLKFQNNNEEVNVINPNYISTKNFEEQL